MDASLRQAIDALRPRLDAAHQVVAFTGAGMSAESGIPTFRDALDRAPKVPAAPAPQGGASLLGRLGEGPGLWSRFDPMQLASEDGFRADPQLVWDWYAQRRDGVRRALPNAGHLALADFARRHPGRLTVITQNVDDLHQRAGHADALRLHGDILADRWLDPPRACCRGAPPVDGRPPRCGGCGNPRRPGVVWFGEALSADVLRRAEAAAAACELMLVVGTSGAVWPAAGLAVQARRAGAFVVVVNPQPSELDDVAHAVLRGTAAGALPALLAATPPG